MSDATSSSRCDVPINDFSALGGKLQETSARRAVGTFPGYVEQGLLGDGRLYPSACDVRTGPVE